MTARTESANANRHAPVTITPMRHEHDARAFHDLNAEWITAHFELEANDVDILTHPHRTVVEPGGQVFLAHSGERTVGCVALMAFGPGTFKIVKMAVASEFRGHGIGRLLLVHAIEQARLLDARTLFLASSSVLVPAIRLYESVGFQHLSVEEWPFARFARANVFMRLNLAPHGSQASAHLEAPR